MLYTYSINTDFTLNDYFLHPKSASLINRYFVFFDLGIKRCSGKRLKIIRHLQKRGTMDLLFMLDATY